MGRVVVLACMVLATALGTLLIYGALWRRSDYVLGVKRMIGGAPVPPRALRNMCLEECWIRALVAAMIGSGACIAYACIRVFERGQANRIISRLRRFWHKDAVGTSGASPVARFNRFSPRGSSDHRLRAGRQ